MRTSGESQGVSLEKVEQLKQLSKVESVFYFSESEFSINTKSGINQKAFGALISDNFFDVLGVRFEQGGLNPSFGFGKEVILSFDFWKANYLNKLSVIGEKLYIDGTEYIITGVLNKGFNGLGENKPLFWISDNHYVDFLRISLGNNQQVDKNIINNIKSNVFYTENRLLVNVISPHSINETELTEEIEQSINSKQSNARVIQEDLLLQAFAGINFHPKAQRLVDIQISALKFISLLLILSVSISYVAAIYNQVHARSKELNIRVTLGASFFSVWKQLIVENIYFFILILFVSYVISLAITNYFHDLPIFSSVNNHTTRLITVFYLFSYIGGLIILAALLPLLQLMKKINQGIQTGKHSAKNAFIEKAILVLQIALMFMVIVASFQVWSSQLTQSSYNRGLVNDEVKVVTLVSGFHDDSELLGSNVLHDLMMENIDNRYNRVNIAFSNRSPHSREMISTEVVIDNRNHKATFNTLSINVSESYFNVLGIKLIKGSFFQNNNEIMINRSFYGSETDELIGKEVALTKGRNQIKKTIVGIVDDVGYTGKINNIPPTIYAPITKQSAIAAEYIIINDKSHDDIDWQLVIKNLLPQHADIEVNYIGQLRELITKQYNKEKFIANLLVGLSAIVSIFVMMGAAAVQNTNLRRKQSDYAIHLVLGASRDSILVRVFGVYLLLALVGAFLVIPLIPIIIRHISVYLEFVINVELVTIAYSLLLLLITSFITNVPAFVSLFKVSLSETIKIE